LQQTLYSLIELQEIDLKLDKVREERGDLPGKVQKLEKMIHENKELFALQKEQISQLKVEEKNHELDLQSGKAQLKKYEAQLYQVKTNKEYDAIASETENVKSNIDTSETKILEIEEKIEELTKSNEEIEKEINEHENEFEENNSALQEKISASAEEENLLRQERQIVEKNLSVQQIKSYERIRGAKKGMAVAQCNGGVCSGCFSFIPPQKVVEIRSMKKLYYCESCGRILIYNKNED
jgi:predicted  nucleic acid-binding Zn-ribbon protein